MFKRVVIMMKYLILTIFIASAYTASAWNPESVDVQTAKWEEIHAAKRAITGFSNITTNFPPVLDRIAYMAGYVRNAIAGNNEREARVDEVMHEAQSLSSAGKLTFKEATSLFWNLAAACDKTHPLTAGIKKEYAHEYTLVGPEAFHGDYNFERDRCYICVPKGGLKLSRIVDGYLRPIHLVYIVLPNQELTSSPHGNQNNQVLRFFEHDLGHTNFMEGLAKWWPWFEVVSRYRASLSPESQERKMVDVLLFQSFQENLFVYGDPVNATSMAGETWPNFMQKVNKDLFIHFVDKVRSTCRVHFWSGDKNRVGIFSQFAANLVIFLKAKKIIPDTNESLGCSFSLNIKEQTLQVYGGPYEKSIEIPCTVMSIGYTTARTFALELEVEKEIFK